MGGSYHFLETVKKTPQPITWLSSIWVKHTSVPTATDAAQVGAILERTSNFSSLIWEEDLGPGYLSWTRVEFVTSHLLFTLWITDFFLLCWLQVDYRKSIRPIWRLITWSTYQSWCRWCHSRTRHSKRTRSSCSAYSRRMPACTIRTTPRCTPPPGWSLDLPTDLDRRSRQASDEEKRK